MESLGSHYKHKVKTAEEIAALIGDMPRKRKVIMCHGVFDVVHPGHLRHLLYAKSKANILIASLTADRHISKGKYRPHVPQELRALNLAAFEIVDYVIIDPEPTPLKSLALIKPDIFAKGYEYQASGLPLKTQDELEVIRSYGGEIIFTPGDHVFSSSQMIEAAPPSLRIEKLITLMESTNITFGSLRRTLDNLGGRRVHVVGDTIVDTFTYASMIGGQTKTPTISVLFDHKVDYVGGAGIVAEHLKAAGAEVVFSTVLGEDALKDFVLEGMGNAGVECKPVIDKTRPTTNKNAIISGGYRLLKVDTLDNRSISDEIVLKMAKAVATEKAEALVFSDFRHGMFNRRTIPTMTDAIPEGMYKVADSQVASRWGNITEFRGFDLITPNEREARFALGDQDSGIRPLAADIYDAAQCKTLILKLGDKGVLTCRHGDHQSLDSFFVVDSFVDRLVDGVGAGDALLAYSTLSMLANKCELTATVIGSMAAACECEKDGNIPINIEDVHRKLDAVEREVKFDT
ncbi:MAG TPA: PfkB family carbohydrate kinase [Xanthobacteraceae bacterium]|nr:PfkB family carbohydrate kinase [Xanthobacteraceae bacterium]